MEKTQRQRGESHEKIKAESGVMWLLTKEAKHCQQSPEARKRAQNRFSLRDSKRN